MRAWELIEMEKKTKTFTCKWCKKEYESEFGKFCPHCSRFQDGANIKEGSGLPDNIKFYNNVHGFHHDQTDGTLYAYDPTKYPHGFDLKPGGVYGYLDWASFGGEVWIQMVEVFEGYKRMGIATAMVNELKKENDSIQWSGTTDSGEKLRKSIEGET